MNVVLADTGPLVALFDRRERFHGWAVEQVRTIAPPLITCEPVLAELCFLLAGLAGGVDAVRRSLADGALRLDFSLGTDWEAVLALMAKYSRQPMSLADGCLVRMAEKHPEAKVFTLDGHFRIYRRNRRQVIPLIIPEDV